MYFYNLIWNISVIYSKAVTNFGRNPRTNTTDTALTWGVWARTQRQNCLTNFAIPVLFPVHTKPEVPLSPVGLFHSPFRLPNSSYDFLPWGLWLRTEEKTKCYITQVTISVDRGLNFQFKAKIYVKKLSSIHYTVMLSVRLHTFKFL